MKKNDHNTSSSKLTLFPLFCFLFFIVNWRTQPDSNDSNVIVFDLTHPTQVRSTIDCKWKKSSRQTVHR